MALALITAGLLVLGLALVQVWTIWYLRREVRRLEFRLSESLDDEDLLEFQVRLQGLLVQVRETAAELVDGVDKRRESLAKSIEKANEAEKNLALRTLERAALEARSGGAKTQEAQARAKASKPLPHPKPESAPPKAAPQAARQGTVASPASGGRPSKAESAEEAEAREDREAADARRSYLVRPPAAPPRYQKIYDLADQGLSREQIARQAGLLPGEVDLILNLRRSK